MFGRITQNRLFSTLMRKGLSFQVQKQKFALLYENQDKSNKIVFPDYKSHLNLNIHSSSSIKKMLSENRSIFDNEIVYSIIFYDEVGDEISDTTDSEILSRLNFFRISINRGEKIYNCYNVNYLGNSNINENPSITPESQVDWNEINEIVLKHNLNFKEAIIINNLKNKLNSKETQNSKSLFTYSDIIASYLKNKYNILNEFLDIYSQKRNSRMTKFINTYYYACLAQVITLNLSTFVFFSWDVMEPITTCLTYMNIVFGLYFWSATSYEFQIGDVQNWVQSKNIFHKKLVEQMIVEQKELKDIYEKDRL